MIETRVVLLAQLHMYSSHTGGPIAPFGPGVPG